MRKFGKVGKYSIILQKKTASRVLDTAALLIALAYSQSYSISQKENICIYEQSERLQTYGSIADVSL